MCVSTARFALYIIAVCIKLIQNLTRQDQQQHWDEEKRILKMHVQLSHGIAEVFMAIILLCRQRS